LLLAAAAGCATPSPDPASSGAAEFEQLIRERKEAVARGDSSSWLRAASLHPQAVCVDAGGRLRECRPDFASPTEWQLRIAIESLQVRRVDSIAVVTYRQTDTVQVGAETVQSAFRYVETYRREGPRWGLLALAEIPVPGSRVPVEGDTSRYGFYAGIYPSGSYTLTVSRAGNHLVISASGEPPDTLFPLSPTRFFARGDHGEYEFVQSGSRPATELLYRTNGQALHYRRRDR
jgi:hypothetical protein